MNEKELMYELQLCIPNFSYDNGIAYEIEVSSETISFMFTDNSELSIYSLGECELSQDFINRVMDFMELKLDEEISSNKLNWYYNYI